MNLGARALPPTLPPIRSSYKATSVEDVMMLLRILDGKDPTWRFLQMRQIEEIKKNVDKVIPEREQKSALKGDVAQMRSIKDAVTYGQVSRQPFLAREMCAVLDARERQARWEEHRTRGFEDAPLSLRLLLNARVRIPSKRLCDLPSASTCPLLKDAITTAILKQWVQHEPGERPGISDEARQRIIGCIRSSMVRPLGIESVARLFGGEAARQDTLGAKIADCAEQELKFYFTARRTAEPKREVGDSLQGKTIGAFSKAPIVEHALEVIGARKRYGRDVVVKAVLKGFEQCADPDLRRTDLPKQLSEAVASIFLPYEGGVGIISGGDVYVRAIFPAVKNTVAGFEAWIPVMNELLSPKYREGALLRSSSSGVQREIVSLAGTWLSRSDVQASVKGELKPLLLREASSHNPRALIETALFWICKSHDLFTREELRKVLFPLLMQPDRDYLYHSLHFTAQKERGAGRSDMLGALEMVISLLKEERFGVEEGVAAYQGGGLIAVRRNKNLGNGLWRVQRQEIATLLAEVNRLCGGEPERACGAELEQRRTESRLDRNQRCKESRHRRERLDSIAGNYRARQGKAA